MAYLMNGNKVSMPLANFANLPLDAKTVADSVSQALDTTILPMTARYVGLMIFCEAENNYYVFSKHDDGTGTGTLTSGILNSDFQYKQFIITLSFLLYKLTVLSTFIINNENFYSHPINLRLFPMFKSKKRKHYINRNSKYKISANFNLYHNNSSSSFISIRYDCPSGSG